MNTNGGMFLGLIPTVFLTALACSLPGILIGLFLRIRLASAILLAFALDGVAALWLFMMDSPAHRIVPHQSPVAAIAFLFAMNTGLALLIKLYRAAILNNVTPEERATGAAGLREWLFVPNILVVVLFAAGAYFSLDYNFIAMLILGTCVLLAYPLVNTMLQPTTPIAPPQSPAEERQRVLALVEAGKITAEDGTELLTALAQSQAAQVGAPSMINGPRRIMLLGATVVMLGFLLPWFTVNVGQQLHDTVSAMQQTFSQMPGLTAEASGLTAAPPPNTGALQITIHGGDVRNGLGWIMLAIAVGSAGLPFFWESHESNRQQQRNAIFAALLIGSITLLYLLSTSFNSVTSIEVGFVFVGAGYLLLWIGAIRGEMVRRSTFGVVPALATQL